jgi:hypothetical protein
MEIEASTEWVVIEWEPHSLVIHSTQASQSRKTKTLRQREVRSYTEEVLPKKLTTQSIIEKVPLFFFENGGLSKCLKYRVPRVKCSISVDRGRYSS